MSAAEHWLPLSGFPGYEVSDAGRVRSFHKRPAGSPLIRKLKGRSKDGYLRLTLHSHVDGTHRRTSRLVHSLVLEAFAGPRPPGMLTRHLDGDPTNNALSNLAYGTPSENHHDSLRHGTYHWSNQPACVHGHLYDEANTGYTPDGNRRCLTCRKAYNSRKAARARAERRAA